MNWKSGNGYSSREIDRMQRDAMERVKEMQERSRRAVSGDPPEQTAVQSQPAYPQFMKRPEAPREASPSPSPSPPPTPQPQAAQAAPPSENKGGLLGGLFGGGNPLGSLGSLFTGGANGPITRVMDALGIDNDKIIILALIFILINNQADKKLILALCYILF